ncbi:MAG: DNA primase [Pseudomonadota bacterium]
MTITPQWKDELRARITLSTVINRTTKLQRAGREWKACCPFHDEKTPSFTVNDQKGFYHCFGCGAHGDVISWMTEQRGLSFIDACKELAAEAGMEVPAPDPVAAKRAEKRASLVDVTTEAQNWFVQNLKSSEGAEALAYLKGRGLSSATLREFGFGYAPESKQALPTALARFDEQMLVETGMRIETDDGTQYDRFRGRVMLPIQDARGRVIAFGGRILGKREGVAKYLNSPDTPLFDKGRNLYNLHRAAPASRQTGRVIVVEGYMDVVALAQAGFADAVAPMGTALTEMQLEMLWRMVEIPILCFDGDTAGQRAAIRAIDRALPLLSPTRSLSILTLPQGTDPDDLVSKHGPEHFSELLEQAQSLVEHIWRYEQNATPLETPEQKAHLRQRLIEWSFKIQDVELQKLYRREFLDRYYSFINPSKFGERRKFVDHGKINSESLSLLRQFIADGQREMLCKAVFAALARHPELINQFHSRLLKYNPRDEEVQFALDVFLDVGDSQIDGVALPEDALGQIALWSERVTLPFPFLKPNVPVEFVSRCLDEAISILVEKPNVDAELEKATNRFGETLSEADAIEQARLREIQDSLIARMREMRELAP